MKVFTLLIFLFFNLYVHSQSRPSVPGRNAVSFEIGKNGLVFNLSLDHKVQNNNFGFKANIGSNLNVNTISIIPGGGVYYLFGKDRKFLELGLDMYYYYVDSPQDDVVGLPLFFPNSDSNTLYPSLNIGYRKYKRKGIFRCGLSPGYIKPYFIPGAYVSWGFSFGKEM